MSPAGQGGNWRSHRDAHTDKQLTTYKLLVSAVLHLMFWGKVDHG